MELHKIIAPAAALLISHGAAAQGEWRCDCTSVVESCSAEVAVLGSYVEISSDHQQCSRVDYFIDGLPFVAVVVDGSSRQDWIARTNDPRVIVQSCQVCRDNSSAAASATPRPAAAPAADAVADAASDTPLRPLIEVEPIYPPAARRAAGQVELELTVNPGGDVANARVVSAEPANVFDQAALAAVTRWRYPADPERAPQTVRARLNFTPPQPPAARPVARPEAVPGARVAATGPRNQCVRENEVYNFGDSVEIGLMNACDEPLVVYGCAAGTGRYVGRWVCVDSESQGSLLVAPDDGRVGDRTALATQNGARTYTYADSFVVTRAPNTEVWWVACPTADAECRSSARQWTRSIDRQVATIDPQDRSPIAIARSY